MARRSWSRAIVARRLPEWRTRQGRPLPRSHGDQARIQGELARAPSAAALCEVRHTDLVISPDEKPAQAMRRGKGSSVWNAVDSIRQGESNAAVSAGNTGALMAISKLILRMMADLERPALVAAWPNAKGFCSVLDVGANIDCDAQRLVEFAIMGEAFHRAVHGAAEPRVGLLNVGSEEQKGHEEVREAHRLLRQSVVNLNYLGFIEGDDIAKGTVDVVVTDGFTGNVALKTTEGALRRGRGRGGGAGARRRQGRCQRPGPARLALRCDGNPRRTCSMSMAARPPTARSASSACRATRFSATRW